jgi:outer membrane protein TolC
MPVPPSTIAVGIPADLLRRRPDVHAAELVALAQNAEIGVDEAQLYPAISITGTFGGAASTANGHNLGQIVSSRGISYAAGPSFQWNILNYGQITNNVRLQDACTHIDGRGAKRIAAATRRAFRCAKTFAS